MKTFPNKKLQVLFVALFAFAIAAPVAGAATITASLTPAFQANLTNTLRLQEGTGLPTFTRATTAYVTDWEGLMKPVLSGEARFTGARRVQNRLTNSGTSFGAGTGSVATITSNFATAPDGTQTATRVQMALNGGSTTNDRSGFLFSIDNEGTGTVVGSVWLKANTGTPTIQFRAALAATTLTLTNTWKRYSVPGTITTTESLYVWLRGAQGTDDSADVLVWHPQIESTTGQSNQNPSEYVSTGSSYGAGVNGVQYFNTQNGNTVASGIVTVGTGAKITSSASGASSATTDATGPLGYFAEGTRTNLALQSEDFGTTWANSTVTLTTDSVAAPNGATTADTLLSQGPGSRMTQAITVPSTSAYTYSVYIKPGNTTTETIILRDNTTATNYQSVLTLTGSGSATQPGGGTATITPVKNGFYLASISVPAGFTASDSAVLYVYTGGSSSAVGDYVYAWGAQLEAAPFASSYIPTTTGSAPRNEDLLSYPDTGNVSDSAGTAYSEVEGNYGSLTTIDVSRFILNRGALGRFFYIPAGGAFNTMVSYDGTITSGVNGGSLNGFSKKMAASWAGSSRSTSYDGGIATTTYDGTFGSGAILVSASSNSWFGNIRNVKIWKKALTSAQLTTMTSSNTTIARVAVPQTTIKTPTKTGLVGAWTFNEGTGTKANDSSGLGHAGTLFGSPVWVSGKLSKALSFDGTSQYMNAGTATLNLGNQLSVGFWINPTNVGWGSGVTNRGIVGKGTPTSFWNGGASTGFGIGLDRTTNNIIVSLSGLSSVYTPFSVPGNQWSFLYFTYDGSTLNAYKNGVLVQSYGAVGASALDDNSYPIMISEVAAGGTGRYMSGSLDDARVYNRALSATEIAALYKSTAVVANAPTNTSGGSLTSGLVGLWSFDGKDMNWGTGTVFDRSGNSNNGSLIGMSTSTSPVMGKIGQALKFRGTSSYINLGTNAALNPLNFSISAWVKPGDLSGAYNYIFSNARDCCGTYNGINFVVSTNTLRGYIWNSTVATVIGGSIPNGSGWHHVAFSYDGSSMILYVDGIQSGFTSSGLGVGSPASFANTIGGMGYAPASYGFNGNLDDVRIYNHALSATEVKSLYNLGR